MTKDLDSNELSFCLALFRPLPGNVPPAITQSMVGHYQRLNGADQVNPDRLDSSVALTETALFRSRLRARLRPPS